MPKSRRNCTGQPVWPAAVRTRPWVVIRRPVGLTCRIKKRKTSGSSRCIYMVAADLTSAVNPHAVILGQHPKVRQDQKILARFDLTNLLGIF